jgi:uncharacterized protein YdeI (YjbR/CyaY-like superfamily)
VEIKETLSAPNRQTWRAWLSAHHAQKTEIWLVTDTVSPGIPYLDAALEALCFGWIDGLAKRLSEQRTAQRFTPRRTRSHWTELNKERARRLIQEGRMTAAGRAALPDLSIDAFTIPPDILTALHGDPQTWANFQAFPASYQRIRIGYVEEMRRRPDGFTPRLNHLLRKTNQNKPSGGTR